MLVKTVNLVILGIFSSSKSHVSGCILLIYYHYIKKLINKHCYKIISIHNSVLISSQLTSKYIREITKNKFIYQVPITDEEINNYVETIPQNKYKINYGGNYETRYCRYIMDIYMIIDNNITLNPICTKRVGVVGPFGVRTERYDFKKIKNNYNPEIKCEIDFISQCKILSKRFDNYKCTLIKEKIFELLYNIVFNFKTYNDVSYSYLIHDFAMYDVKDASFKTIRFVNQSTDLIVNYLYEKLSAIILDLM